MLAVLQQLFMSVAFLVVCAFVFGFLFERVNRGPALSAAIGLTGGVCASLIMTLASQFGGYVIDGRAPVIMIASFFGGPLGALLSLPLPIVLRLDMGGPGAPAGVVAIVIAAIIGAGVRLFCDRTGRAITRKTVLLVAVLSPLTLLALLTPYDSPQPRNLVAIIILIGAWSPFATAMFGILVHNEVERAAESVRRHAEVAFLKTTDLEGTDYLVRQLDHHARLAERYCINYAFLLISIDNAVGHRNALPKEVWNAQRRHVGRALANTLRDADICAPVAFDRFGVLMPHLSERGAYAAAQRVSGAIHEAMSERLPPTTVSIGICCVDETNQPPDVMVDAEAALILATARTPTSAIGPVPTALEETDRTIRSFPGDVAAQGKRAGERRATDSPPPAKVA